MTAQDLHQLGVCDRVVPEPLGGAHRDSEAAIAAVHSAITGLLGDLDGMSREDLIRARRNKFLNIGSKGLAA